jgi:hypothetical protein
MEDDYDDFDAPPPPPPMPPPVYFGDAHLGGGGAALSEHVAASASAKSSSVSAAISAIEDRQFGDKSPSGFVGLSNQGFGLFGLTGVCK